MYPDATSYILIFIVAMSFALLCKFVHPAAFSWQKGECILRFKPTQPEKIMAAHGSREDSLFPRAAFLFCLYFQRVRFLFNPSDMHIGASVPEEGALPA